MVDNTPDKQDNPDANNFARAVKAIVNVPKHAVDPKPEASRLSRYEERTCPDCGAKYYQPTQHKHED